MKELTGRVAVVTGAASGIGRALAEVLTDEGMRVMLADVDAEQLDAAAADLRSRGGQVEATVTDVGDRHSVETLAALTIEAFGAVHVVCNNAGVWTLGAQWETPQDDWRWVVDVNLMGVVHGVATFLPRLLDNPEGGHIVNVASIGGLVAGPFTGPYAATKHAVVGLTKGLRAELQARRAPIGVSLVCPGRVRSGLVSAVNRRPGAAGRTLAPDVQAVADAMRSADATALPAIDAAQLIRDAIRHDQFWVLPGADRHWHLVAGELEEIRAAFAPAVEHP